MVTKKKQHFVPRVYLAAWTDENGMLRSLPLTNGLVRTQKPKEVATKSHLYTLPDIFFTDSDFSNPDYKQLLIENTLGKLEETWATVKPRLDKLQDLATKVETIKAFVILQSLRTPKFLRLNKEIIERAGEDLGSDDATHFAVSMIRLLPELMKNCTLEIIQNLDIPNFITSDNPASHWMHEPRANTLKHIGGIALRHGLNGNPNYRILCPIHPKFFAVLSPNLGIEKSKKERESIRYRPCNEDILLRLNRMTEESADKILFAKSVNDF